MDYLTPVSPSVADEAILRVSKRKRGEHSTKVKNLTPAYVVPTTHVKRLAFIRDLVNNSQERDVTKSDEAMFARAQNFRQKQLYPDGAKAIRALFTAFAEHVNVVTHQIEISLRNASDAAGLSTTSDTELEAAKNDPLYTAKPCISRASRAKDKMVEMGWITCHKTDQVWDKEAGGWIELYYEVTPLFFNAAGITTERAEKQRNERLGFIKTNHLKYGYSAKQAGKLSVSQLRSDRKAQWRKNAFERRATDQTRKKLERALTDKERHEQRFIAEKRVLDAIGHELHLYDLPMYKDLVNKEIATLRKFTKVKPPPH